MFSYDSGDPMLCAYIDTNMMEDVDIQKSLLGYLMIFSREAMSWQSKLHKYITLSSTEVEYIL